MSRLFAKPLCLTSLLAAKQSPCFRFLTPTRSFNGSADIYKVIAPKAVHDGEASGNAKTRKPFTRRDDEHLVVIKQVTTQMVAN